MSAVLQSFIFQDGDFEGTDVFAEKQIIIGRDPSVADLILESSQVSRKHAIIEHDGKTVTIRDAGSTNGILVNDERVDEATISRLDEIRIGPFTLKLKLAVKEKSNEPRRTIARTVPPELLGETAMAEAIPRGEETDRAPVRPAKKAATKKKATKKKAKSAAASRSAKKAASSTKKKAKRKTPPLPPPEDFDDVEPDVDEKDRAPQAEFRTRDEIMDGDQFGAMLENIGISTQERSALSPKRKTPPPPEPMSEPERYARRKRPAKRIRANDDIAARTSTDGEPVGTPDLSVPVPHWSPGSEEDDEDANYVPPYSLVEQLISEDAPPRSMADAQLEVLTFKSDSVHDARLLKPGQSFWIGPKIGFLRRRRARDLPPRVRLLRVKRNGEVTMMLRQDQDGDLIRNGRRRSLADSPEAVRNKRSRTVAVPVRHGEGATVKDGAFSYHVRYVNPPPKLRDDRSWKDKLRPDRVLSKSLGGSALTHLVALIVLAIVVPSTASKPVTLDDEFVEVTLDVEPELQEPEPPPEEPPPPEQPPVAAPKKPPPKKKKKMKKQRPKVGGTAPAPKGVLGLLSKRGLSTAPGPASAVAAVSNLAAVKVPGGTRGFRTSGLQAKLPTSDLQVGGGGGLVTKGGAALLRGGGGGGGRLSGKGRRGVTGVVTKVPRAMRAKGQGTLGRDEIQRVVNAGIGQIQRCYERELLKNPGIAGKVQVEWTIGTSGSVRSSRQAFSNLNSSSVVTCILGVVKRWKFPRPKGGEVVVTYPFNFKGVGM